VSDAGIDVHVVLYVCALAVGAAIVAGLVPALTAAGKHIAGRRSSRAGMTLVALEVGAAFALVVCAALMLRSFIALTSQQIGFQTRHVYTAAFAPKNLFAGGPPINGTVLAPQVRRRIAAVPGVLQTAMTGHVPLADDIEVMTAFWLPGKPIPGRRDNGAMADIGFFSPGYAPLMHIPILAGRTFGKDDRGQIIVVNRTFARKYFGAKPAVGAHIFCGTDVVNGGRLYRIIGVVGDTRDSLTHQPKPTAYWPLSSTAPLFRSGVFTVVLKTAGDDSRLAVEISSIAQRYFPQYAPPQITSLDQVLTDNSAVARTSLAMLATLAGIALLLALAGIYGVVAFSVERRYHEIGIRRALGETHRRLFSRIVGASIVQAILGIALGVVAAAFGARAIEHQLFKTQPFDPASFALTAALLLACAALASAIPAWRALRIDPARTLRYD
jgi:predicted permease